MAEDLQRPANEGRSLHDLANCFIREIMGLKTPLGTIPSLSTLLEAFKTLDATKHPEHFELLTDLQASTLESIWGPQVELPPRTKEGVMWHAAVALLPKKDLQRKKKDSTTNTATKLALKQSNGGKTEDVEREQKGGLKQRSIPCLI